MFQKLRDIGDLIVFKHSIFALPFIFCAMLISSKMADGSLWFGWKLLILGVICAVSARSYAMAVNRYLDAKIDALNPRTANRPSVDGRIGRANLALFILFNALIFIISSYFINALAFELSFLFLIILGAYSYFKRFSALAHVFLGLCLGLSPVAGAVAVLGQIPMWSLLLCCGVTCWTAGFDVLYSLQDMEFDKKAGLFSIPAKYGADAAMFIARLFHAGAVIFWLFFVGAAQLGFMALSGVIITGAILFKEHVMVAKDFSKIDKAFFTLNGWMSVVFLGFIWVDLW